jgi:hypothetical protein
MACGITGGWERPDGPALDAPAVRSELPFGLKMFAHNAAVSRENLDVIRRAVELANEGRVDELIELYHPDAEDRDVKHLPDAPEVHRGRDAIHANMKRWLAAFDDWRVEVIEYVDEEPWVMCGMLWHAVGLGSGAEPPERTWDAFEVQDGMIVRHLGGYENLADIRARLNE